MNLNPRRVASVPDWERTLRKLNGKPIPVSDMFGRPARNNGVPSIWRMELPNQSYHAPFAAFWWVSNEKR